MGNAMYRKKITTTDGGFQLWTNYPPSGISIVDSRIRPYQAIINGWGGLTYLICSDTEWFYEEENELIFAAEIPAHTVTYILRTNVIPSGEWSYYEAKSVIDAYSIYESNHNIYAHAAPQDQNFPYSGPDYNTLAFAKTTTPAQDVGLVESWVRVN